MTFFDHTTWRSAKSRNFLLAGIIKETFLAGLRTSYGDAGRTRIVTPGGSGGRKWSRAPLWKPEASGSEPEASAPRFAGDLSENPRAPASGVTRLCGIMEKGKTALDGTFLTMPVRPGKGLTTPIRSKTALSYDENSAINK